MRDGVRRLSFPPLSAPFRPTGTAPHHYFSRYHLLYCYYYYYYFLRSPSPLSRSPFPLPFCAPAHFSSAFPIFSPRWGSSRWLSPPPSHWKKGLGQWGVCPGWREEKGDISCLSSNKETRIKRGRERKDRGGVRMEKSMCDLVARTGRHQQRYEAGCRLVAGSLLLPHS